MLNEKGISCLDNNQTHRGAAESPVNIWVPARACWGLVANCHERHGTCTWAGCYTAGMIVLVNKMPLLNQIYHP